MILPPDQLTRPQLEARERMHLEMAHMYELQKEPGMAKKFCDLAAFYRKELDTRPAPPPETPRETAARERRAAALRSLVEVKP